MAATLRSDNQIYLIGTINSSILGSKLPSNKQVLSVFFYNLRLLKLKARESASLTIREASVFWEKARIPIRQNQNCIQKLLQMYKKWQNLQKMQ